MRHDKLRNQLDLLLMLTENRQWTIDQMCEVLGVKMRNLYYYLELFKGADFGLTKNGGFYSISRNSKFITKLCDIVKFTDEEALLLRNLLDEVPRKDAVTESAIQKLDRFYDFSLIKSRPMRRKQIGLVDKIYQAIKDEKVIGIIDYSSPHSGTVKTRYVEPFMLMNGNRDIRAYELKSKMNKTFKISRMRDVEITDQDWTCRAAHKQMYTDIFGFSSEILTKVKLRLDQLSKSVLLEEYPRSESSITDDIFTTNVCSMVGIGRFVLGLYDHVEIIEGEELKQYIKEKLQQFISINEKV